MKPFFLLPKQLPNYMMIAKAGLKFQQQILDPISGYRSKVIVVVESLIWKYSALI